MRIAITLISAIALSAGGIAVSAAGYDDVIVASPVVSPATAGEQLGALPLAGGLGGAGIVLPLLGALVLVALAADSNGNGGTRSGEVITVAAD